MFFFFLTHIKHPETTKHSLYTSFCSLRVVALNIIGIQHSLVEIQHPPDRTYYIYLSIQLQDSELISRGIPVQFPLKKKDKFFLLQPKKFDL